MPLAKQKLFLDVFRELPDYNFLWKFESKSLAADLPKNAIVRPWLPVSDLLSDSKVKAIYFHGGLLTTQEAMWRAVPMIIMPFGFDQNQVWFDLQTKFFTSPWINFLLSIFIFHSELDQNTTTWYFWRHRLSVAEQRWHEEDNFKSAWRSIVCVECNEMVEAIPRSKGEAPWSSRLVDWMAHSQPRLWIFEVACSSTRFHYRKFIRHYSRHYDNDYSIARCFD